jgi:putative FmdB family regulatory protein
MPIYEYRCESCGDSYDKLKRLADADNEPCRTCGAPAERSRVNKVAGVVRGAGGWSSPAPRSQPVPRGGTMRRTDSRGIAKNMSQAEINSLPVVGPDGNLYSADGKKDITPGGPSK